MKKHQLSPGLFIAEAVMLCQLTVFGGILTIDSGGDLTSINDTTANGTAVTAEQSFSTNLVAGGYRETEANSTVVNDSYNMGIWSIGGVFGDIGNYHVQGYFSFVYGEHGDLNIAADKNSSAFLFDFTDVHFSPNLTISLNNGANTYTVNNFTGDLNIAANAVGWSNSGFNWADIDAIRLQFYFDDSDNHIGMQAGSFVQLTNSSVVPEPASILMIGLGGLLITGYRRFFGRI